MTLERRPAGRAVIDENGQVHLVPGDGPVKPSRRWEDSPDGRRVAKFRRRNEMAKRKKKIERLKAGLPSEPQLPPPLTREERLDQHYRSLEVLREAIPNCEPGSYGRRVMMRDAKQIMSAIKDLEAGREPEQRGNAHIEKATIR